MTRDLADIHGPIGDLFSHGTDEPESNPLTESQLEGFQQRGFVTGPRLLSDRQLDVLRRDLAQLCLPAHAGRELWYEYHSNESTDPNTVLFHALGAWRLRESFHDLLWHPTLVKAAEQLLDGPVRFWHDQLFCKPAHHGGVVAWHQDYSYWTRTQPMAHLSCWIGLDDSTVENGCLHYIPGSHRWPLLPVTGLSGDMAAIRNVLTDSQREQFHPVAVELKAGQCVFHHAMVVHGSFENRSHYARRAAVLNVVRDGVRSADAKPLLEGANVVAKGAPLAGRCYPLLSVGSGSLR